MAKVEVRAAEATKIVNDFEIKLKKVSEFEKITGVGLISTESTSDSEPDFN